MKKHKEKQFEDYDLGAGYYIAEFSGQQDNVFGSPIFEMTIKGNYQICVMCGDPAMFLCNKCKNKIENNKILKAKLRKLSDECL
jgi:hypothetical protein